MPARLVICPVDVIVEEGITRRAPRVATIPDPGRPPVDIIDPDDGPITIIPTYVFSAAISDGQPGQENDFCFCLVAGVDMGGLDADPGVESLFEVVDDQLLDDLQTWLVNTPKILGWKAGKINKIKGKLHKKGITTGDLTDDSPLHDYCNHAADKVAPGWDIRRAKTTLKGA